MAGSLAHGFTGGESTVRSFVRKEKNGHMEMFIPLTADWGEQAQVDWGRAKVYIGGKLTEVSLFCLTVNKMGLKQHDQVVSAP